MNFGPQTYGSAVAAILRREGDGHRLMPRTASGGASGGARRLIREAGARQLFHGSRAPEAAASGLYLYLRRPTTAFHRLRGAPFPSSAS